MKKITRVLVILFLFASICCVSSADNTAFSDVKKSASQNTQERILSVERLYIQTYPEKTVYKAFEKLNTAGLSVRAVYSDGSDGAVRHEDLTINYKRDDCLRAGDDGVTIFYGGRSVYLPLTVERISYDLSSFSFGNFSVEYNGREHSYTNTLPSIIGLDGIPLNLNIIGGGINVGTYSVTLDFSTESRDYLTPESKIVTMTVLPATREIVWSDLSFTYDSKSKSPIAYYEDVSGAKIYPAVYGAATEAGSDYIAQVSVNDPNYVFKNTSVKFEIKKADYDFSSVVWSEGEFVYDGTQKRVYLSGLPDGVSITGYRNERQRAAGIYTASAILSYDTRNYNPPPEQSYEWRISPAEYDMSGVSFLSLETVYDGYMHYPTVRGNMPTGADGIRLEYSFSTGATHVSEGEVLVTVSFSTRSKNYISPEPITVSVKILPRPIYVTWSSNRLYYTGESVLPSAVSPECKIIVEGGGVNVGKYIATARAENSDFTVENKDFEYEILKSNNSWLTYPKGKTCYENREPDGFGEAKFGKVVYRFFTDSECKNEIKPPRIAGTYYAIAEVSESENYYGITSEPFSFTVVEVVAVGLKVDIQKAPLRVFDKLTASDFLAFLSYNDGTMEAINSALVKIKYQSGDHLRLADKHVTFTYGKFSCDVSVTVDLAQYDLSNMRWEGASVTYDGSPKSPMLIGLPEGIRIISYIGAEKTDAGEYTVSARIEYDSANYEKPQIPDCKFVIKKCVLDIPTVSVIFNGEPREAVSDSDLYIIISEGDFTEVGKYTVFAALTSPENYEFENGDAVCKATFEIAPIPIYIRVPDISVHLWDKIGMVEYTHTDGELLVGDKLELEQYVDGDSVKFRSLNKNYTVIQIGGAITRLPYPSLRGTVIFSLYLLVLILLVLLVLFVYRNRHRVKNAVGVLRCKWYNRNFSVNEPKTVKYTAKNVNRFSIEAHNKIAKEEEIHPEIPATEKKEDSSGETESMDSTSACDDMLEDVTEDIENHDKMMENEQAPSDEAEEDTENSLSEEVDTAPHHEGYSIDVERADELITDSLAKNLLRKEGDVVYTDGASKGIINVDTLNEHFGIGERIDINSLKSKSLIPYDTAYIKVLARGVIDKPLTVYANDFSLSAVKMIALTGGEAIKAVTMKQKNKNQKST